MEKVKSAELKTESVYPQRTEDETSRLGEVPAVRRYIVAAVFVAVAFAIRYWLTPVLGEELPFLLFVAAALGAAWYGGALVGVVALLLGLFLGDYFFLTSTGGPDTSPRVKLIHIIRYTFTASVGIVLIEVLRRGKRRVEAAAEELRWEVARRKRSEEALLEAQAQLRSHAEGLEQRVAERTASLTRTVASLEDLLYHIAHNLRAPLRAMDGFTTLLLTETAAGSRSHCQAGSLIHIEGGSNLNATAQDYATQISLAANRMDKLIQDLLDYGRLGHMEIPLKTLSLEQAVEGALAELSYQVQSQNAAVEIVRPLPEVRANAKVLKEVLINLLDNALKFVAHGTAPQVRLWAEEGGSRVRLWVEDNGIGVSSQYLERVFLPFERLHPVEAYGGTGIGLAIVKQGAQRMGGGAGVEPKQGAGSRFWVELPAASEAQ